MADLILGVALAVVTRYSDVGPTYCGQHTAQLSDTWLAVPVEQLGTLYQCGDLVYIRGEDWSLLARVQDVGPFGKNFVVQEDGTLAPILFDVGGVPPWGDDLSARVLQWTNITREAQRYAN